MKIRRGGLAASSVLMSVLGACGGYAPPTPVTRDPTTSIIPSDGDPGTPPAPENPGSGGGTNPGGGGAGGGGSQTPAPPQRFASTKFCAPDAHGNFVDTVNRADGARGTFPDGDTNWAEWGACIHRPIREVWGVLHNQDAIVWSGIDEKTVKVRTDLPVGVSHHYEINYVVHNIITVDWTMEWFHSVKRGTFDNPLQVLINYQRVTGTQYIPYWEGSIVLDSLADNVTAFMMRDQVRRSRGNADKTLGTVTNLYDAVVKGTPNYPALDAGARGI